MNNHLLIKLVIALGVILGITYWFLNSSSVNTVNVTEPIAKPLSNERSVNPGDSLKEEPNEEAAIHQSVGTEYGTSDITEHAINLLPEPDYGTAEFLDARALALEKFPNDPIKVLRHRLTGTNFSQVYSLLETVLQSKEGMIGPYELSFFDDIPCTFDSATAKQRSSGTWVIDSQCKEYFRSSLTIMVSPEKSNFAAALNYQGRKIQLMKLTEQFAVVHEYDPASWPKSNH